MTKPILSTHVGSLPRSQSTVDLIFARENNESYDVQAFQAEMTSGVASVVQKQKEAGIDIVSDGETSKISYATYVKDRYTGFSGDSPRNAPADLQLFPDFLKKLASSGGTPTYSRPFCTGTIKSKGNEDLQRDLDNLRLALKQQKINKAFMNAASPGVIALFLPNQYYPSREKYIEALAEVMKAEYKAIIDAGFDLQLDCPDLALSRHMLFQDLSDEAFIKIANTHVEALNYAIADLPQERVRMHICWGNYEGPHVCDIPMQKMFDTLMSVNAGQLLFETANPRHGHEWEVFEQRKQDIPDSKILIPGVIDSTSNFVEHPRLVAQRIQKFVDIVGRDRVIAGSDCGFGTFAGFGAVVPDIAYAKLQSLSQGAKLV
ncbi:methionine synthase II [Glaciecola punicea ACAM 611]|jgi:5-methyltetrahydropteroyltriglutamate--homocysteine methyltransferase|uniref:Methionine synthase II n=1 Tax=Glaciecola punicea ACAM 611 TaxID=1121923 RepID=H5T8A1_9ALTE|nr:cobalamin-independent methionine synthase II family protein [Glaciecola punicea]OFA29909.1 enterotoxin [Glaciecola punicea]GAB54542.1 methionine synthase II [Glaciecola punicea ACAM 611]